MGVFTLWTIVAGVSTTMPDFVQIDSDILWDTVACIFFFAPCVTLGWTIVGFKKLSLGVKILGVFPSVVIIIYFVHYLTTGLPLRLLN